MNRKSGILAVAILMMIGMASAGMTAPSSINVESNNGFFSNYNGKVLQFEVTANDFDSDELRIDSEDFNAKLDEGRVPDGEEVTFKVDSKNSLARYSVRDGSRDEARLPDYKRHVFDWGNSWSSDFPDQSSRIASYRDWAGNNCADLNGDGSVNMVYREWASGWLGDYVKGHVLCADRSGNIESQVAEISSQKQEVMTTTFSVNGNTKTLSNADIGEGKTTTFGSGIKINWQGGLESGYNFPNPDDELIAYNNQDGLFLIKKSRYESEWKNYLADAESYEKLNSWDDHLNDNKAGGVSESELESSAEVKLDSVLQKYSSSEFYDHSLTLNGDSLSQATIELDSKTQVGSYPSWIVYLKADDYGYYIPDATPEITGTNEPVQLQEGRSGEIQVDVKNVGTGNGDFSARILSCSEGFTGSGISDGLDLDPGETATARLGVTFNSGSYDSKQISGSCDVEVNNLRDSTESLQVSVGIEGEQSDECDPDSYYTEIVEENGETFYRIMQCQSDGLNTEKVTDCNPDERAVQQSDGSYSCEVPEDQVDEEGGNAGDDPADTDPTDPGEGEKVCLINTEVPSLTGSREVNALCVAKETMQKLRISMGVVAGLLTGIAGFRLGEFINGERQIQGRNKYYKRRQVNRVKRGNRTSKEAVLGGLLGFIAGMLFGYWLGIWGLLVVGILLILQLMFL